jgi:hypothetical protein
MSADWVNDREPYCLTLGPALYFDKFSDRPDIQNLFIEYFNPSSPHFARIADIQTRIAFGSDWTAKVYFVRRLPVQIYENSAPKQPLVHAATLLNILMIAGLGLAERFMIGKDTREIFSQKLAAAWVLDGETIEGTVQDILMQQPHSASARAAAYVVRTKLLVEGHEFFGGV